MRQMRGPRMPGWPDGPDPRPVVIDGVWSHVLSKSSRCLMEARTKKWLIQTPALR